MKELKDRQIWNSLTTEQKQDFMLELVPQLPTGFEWSRIETFERFGQHSETGVFMYKGSEFVFVPGDTVTLGWHTDPPSPAKDAVSQQLLTSFEQQMNLSAEEAQLHIQAILSPVREARIEPLLIERQFSPAGWYAFPISELDPEEDVDILERIEEFRVSPHRSLEVYQYFRLERDGEQIVLDLFDDSETFEEWSEEEIADGFTLPSEDEWEYLYGAGVITLFPWGNEIEASMRLKHFNSSAEASQPYELEQPNGFGLYFPGDPYQKELTLQADGYIGKGGDGGTHIHGGLGRTLGYLPTATAFRDPYEQELDWAELLDCLVYRRIVRLNLRHNAGKNSH